MHKSQIQAYREAALKALREWAKSSAVPLEPMEENDTEDSFVERCVKAVAKLEQPDWKIDNGKAVVAAEIRKRAKAIYAKYHPGDDDAEEGEEEESGGEEEESGEEGEEEEEDAEEEEDCEMEEEQTAKPTKQQANKAKKQQKGAKNTKKQAHKKGTTAKQGTANTRVQAARKGPGGNRSRRGGRGGKSKGN